MVYPQEMTLLCAGHSATGVLDMLPGPIGAVSTAIRIYPRADWWFCYDPIEGNPAFSGVKTAALLVQRSIDAPRFIDGSLSLAVWWCCHGGTRKIRFAGVDGTPGYAWRPDQSLQPQEISRKRQHFRRCIRDIRKFQELFPAVQMTTLTPGPLQNLMPYEKPC